MPEPDLISMAALGPRGRRPEFTGDPMLERLYGITLALTAELAVTRERLDTVERLLSRHELLARREIEAFHPEAAEARERGQLQQEYLSRVFRVLLQDQAAGQPAHEADETLRAGGEPGGRRVAWSSSNTDRAGSSRS